MCLEGCEGRWLRGHLVMEGQAAGSAIPAWLSRDVCQCPQSFVTKVVIFCLPAVVNYSALPLLMLLFGSTSKVLCSVLVFISACLGRCVARRVTCLLITINILFPVGNNTQLISTLHLSWFPTIVPAIFLTEAGRNILIIAVCGLKTTTNCLHIICKLSQFVYQK